MRGGASVLNDDRVVWDQHGCLPLRPDESAVDDLRAYAEAGVDFVSINVGTDSTPPLKALKVLSAFRDGVRQRAERFALVRSAPDVVRAKATGRLGIAFDLEGTEPLDGSLDMVRTYYDLGVRTMLIAYTSPNRAAGGCQANPETVLTRLGRASVREMNQTGMLA